MVKSLIRLDRIGPWGQVQRHRFNPTLGGKPVEVRQVTLTPEVAVEGMTVNSRCRVWWVGV